MSLSLLLASGSPQRRQLLTAAGYAFEIIVPHESVECGICSTGGPAALVSELALKKAANVASQLQKAHSKQPSLLIACDTVAECDGSILGKPQNEEHAQAMLHLLRGRTHRVYSGLCVWPYQVKDSEASPETRIVSTQLRMDNVSDDKLDEYLASNLWQGKAGAFGYQDRVGWLHIEQGSESNVIGLPMELLDEMLTPWKNHLSKSKNQDGT